MNSSAEIRPTELLAAPAATAERFWAAVYRFLLRTHFRVLIGPPTPPWLQRPLTRLLAGLTFAKRGTASRWVRLGGMRAQLLTPPEARQGVMLYLHGGAFMVGSASTHRAVTTRLALYSERPVYVPEFRLAPEHPYPAALDDALACYQELLRAHGPQIVVAGDSAGGSLSVALALALRARGLPQPAALLLMSPVTDPAFSGASIQSRAAADPMLRLSWVRQGAAAYACPEQTRPQHEHAPLRQPLDGLAPMFIQVGNDEILRDDSTRLASHARRCGVAVTLEVHAERWHVFQMQSAALPGANAALQRLARYARAALGD